MHGFWKYDTKPYLHGPVDNIEHEHTAKPFRTDKHDYVTARGIQYQHKRFYLSHLFPNDEVGQQAGKEYDKLVKIRDEAIKSIRDTFDLQIKEWEEKYKGYNVEPKDER